MLTEFRAKKDSRLFRTTLPAFLALFIAAVCITKASSDFEILIERERPNGQLVPGQISVNGRLLGRTYENADYQILPGEYKGILRYVSKKGFAQGPMGKFAQTGDFLIEVVAGNGRNDILLHGGNKPRQSTGCILLGPIGRDPSTLEAKVGDDHPLRKLRILFYGSDNPDQTPDKSIVVIVK